MNTLKNIPHFDLIEECKNGDERAQIQLYKAYSQAMFNTAFSVLRNDSDAEECMQEAFLRAFGSLHQFKAESTFGAWLKRITINECLRKQRKIQLEFEPLNPLQDPVESEPEELKFNFSVAQVKSAMAALPSGYQVVLELYLLEGYDHEEIAQILDMSASTSRSQFLRGKKKLVEKLNQLHNG